MLTWGIIWVNDWLIEHMKDWKNKWIMDEFKKDRMNELMNEWKNSDKSNKTFNELTKNSQAIN